MKRLFILTIFILCVFFQTKNAFALEKPEFETGSGDVSTEYDEEEQNYQKTGYIHVKFDVKNTKEGILEFVLFNEKDNITVSNTVCKTENYEKRVKVPIGTYYISQTNFVGCTPTFHKDNKDSVTVKENGCPVIHSTVTYDEKDELGSSSNGGKNASEQGKELMEQWEKEDKQAQTLNAKQGNIVKKADTSDASESQNDISSGISVIGYIILGVIFLVFVIIFIVVSRRW